MMKKLFLLLVLALGLGGCVYYEPVPAYTVATPPNFDRVWNATLGAMQDAGMQISSADPASRLIRGSKDGIEATATVVRQPDQSLRVQFDTRGAVERDPGLSNRFSQAYDRRMGR